MGKIEACTCVWFSRKIYRLCKVQQNNKIPNIPQCNTSTLADVPDPPFRFFEGLAPRLGGVTGRVLCTWWLLGLALKRPWLVPGGQPHALTAWTGLENTTLTLQRACYRRVLCTWWLLGLALKRPWLVPGRQPHALTAWTGLETRGPSRKKSRTPSAEIQTEIQKSRNPG